MNISIRHAQKEEAEDLESLLCDVYGNEFRNLAKSYINAMFSDDFRKPNFLIALDSEKIIGTASYSEELFSVEVWGISWVGVLSNYRHHGIGESLINECITQIKKKILSPATVILRTYPYQTGLYDKTGFTVSGADHEGGQFMTKTI